MPGSSHGLWYRQGPLRTRIVALGIWLCACGGKTGASSDTEGSSASDPSISTGTGNAGGTGGTPIATNGGGGTGARSPTGSQGNGGEGDTCEGGHWALCDDACVEIAYDSDNCGGCGVACPDEVCPPCLDECIPVDNGCILGDCRNDCSEGEIGCGASCVDVCDAASHCGACNVTVHGG